jgi:hypothetical protein
MVTGAAGVQKNASKNLIKHYLPGTSTKKKIFDNDYR